MKGNKHGALKTSSLGAICTKFQCKRTPGTPPNRSLGPPMKPAPTAPLKSDRTASPLDFCPFIKYSKAPVVRGGLRYKGKPQRGEHAHLNEVTEASLRTQTKWAPFLQ